MFQRILVGVDGSTKAARALEQALDLALLTGGTVHAVSVVERLPAYAGTVGEVDEERRYENHYFEGIHREAFRLAKDRSVPFSAEILPGHPADVLVRVAAQRGADLIVIGHTGHSRIHNFLLGSTADRVTEHAPCPVLVVR